MFANAIIMRRSTNKSISIMQTSLSKRLLCAAAVSTLSSSRSSCCAAFLVMPTHHTTTLNYNCRGLNLNQPTPTQSQQQSRLFFSQKDDNSDLGVFKKSGRNLFKKGIDKVKSIIPFGKSEEEKRAAIVKKERKEQISGGLNTMLKDMPFPIRMMGKMVSPLLAKAAEEIAEQTKEAQEMWEDARIRIMNDPSIASEVGEPIQISQPFSQSQATTVINGQSSARVQSSFQVVGPRGSGIATLESVNGEIRTLNVNVNGRVISVGQGRERNAVFGKSTSGLKSDDNNIIEAEIIEKKEER